MLLSRARLPYPTAGFTLVELSIVLAILGLLVGSIVAAQSIIRSSELRNITAEYQRYDRAIDTFRDKYLGLPGDLSNATSFWSGEANGDGNGQIMGSAPTTAATNETAHFWTQLVAAGLAEGSYTPSSWAALSNGTTNPRSKLGSAGWSIRYVGPVGTDDTVIGTSGAATQIMYEGTYGNAFFLMSGGSLASPSGGVLKTSEAYNIDSKIDDGAPSTGSVVSLESQGSSTAGTGCGNTAKSTSSQASAQYDFANDLKTACSLVFKSGY